jgi:integrase
MQNADMTKVLTRREIHAVLGDLRARATRSKNAKLNLVIFRLATCCGLRASEIAQLQADDVRTEMPRPHIRIRVGASKGGKSRRVPLWWDRWTLDDLAAWRAHRAAQGAVGDEAFVSSWQPGRDNEALSRFTLRKRYRTACRKLGDERLQSLTIHHGRHTFISHALAGGRTLAEVRDAAGHSNVTVTSGYLHVVVGEDGLGTLFG